VSSVAHIRFWACLLGLSAAAAPAQVPPAPIQPAQAQHARVELLSRQSSITPGADQRLGVHFVLETGWHIYWINPGDSGQPPVFKWQLPEGFSIGEIQWPRPERMQPIKELADYGYHNEVLLPLVLHVPSPTGSRASADIGVEAKWLVCREVCISEYAQLHLSLPVAVQAKPNPSAGHLFAATEKLVPKPLPRSWKVSATSGKDDFVLAIMAGKRITKADFFPLEPGQIDNPAPQKIQSSATGIKITLKKSDLLLHPIAVLRGVLVIPGSPAYRIEAPVRQPIQ
jgi:DsbC/DsbD-like thiol-disulfide interchange protein